MDAKTKVMVLKEFFTVPGKEVTNAELLDLRKADKDGFDRLVADCQVALAKVK